MKNIYKAIGLIIAAILIFSILQSVCIPPYKEKETITTITTDSTTVDSLKQRIQYLESLPPVIVRDTLFIPEPIIELDSTYTYSFPYRDSLITSRWIVNAMNEIEFNTVVFDYVIKRERRVIKDTETITLTKYRTKTITRRFVETPKSYFTVGFEAGTKSFISPTIGFVTRKKYHILYRYDGFTESHNLGISIPIKF